MLGALKRVADVEYSWREVLMGKAKEAELVVGKWKDHDVLNCSGHTILRWRKRCVI
jgi:hypothetical protein